MSFTETQKAFHLRKMRTRLRRLDYNEDGYISHEDFDLMGRKLAEYSEVTGEQADVVRKEFMKIADAQNLKPGRRIPVEKAAKKASKSILSMSPEKQKAMVHDTHNVLFDAIDTKKDGHICLEEFRTYFFVIAPETSQADIIHSFNMIDVNRDKRISREEFLAAAEDFLSGVEETVISNVFFGKLLDV